MAKDTEARVTFKAFNKDFNKAVAEMGKESKNLRQEMKLQEEQMKHSATESQKLQAKITGLSGQYEIAKRKTTETAAQLERAKAQWGANSAEVGKLESQLRRAQIAEQQIANSMIETTASLERVTAAEQQRTSAAGQAEEQLKALKSTEEDLKGSSEKLTAEYELQRAQLDSNASESEKLQLKMEHLNDAHQAAGESVNNYEQQLEQARTQFGENSVEVDSYERQLLEARTAEQQLANEIQSTADELRRQESLLLSTSEALGKVGDKMKDIGKNMTKKVTAPLVATGGLMTKLSVDQEAAFAQTSTLLEGSEQELNDYKSAIRDLSSDMGIAFEEVAGSVYDALSSDQLQEDAVAFTEKAIKLATGGFTDATKAVDVLTTALNAYGLESEEATNISDMLIVTQDLGKTTVDELASSMGTIIPVAQAQNVAFDELSAGYAVLTKNGIGTAEAGTYMKAMFSELGKAGTKVDKILRAGTGKSFSQLKEEGHTTGDVLQYLQSQADRSGLKLSDLFGNVRAGSGALVLAAKGGTEFDESLAAMGNSAGATEDNFNIMVDTATDKMAVAKETIKNVMAEFGDNILPILADLAVKISDVVKGFAGMDPAIQKVILIIGGIVAAIGPVLVIVGTLISSIGSIVGVFATVSLAIAEAGGLFALLSTKLAFLGPVFTALTGPIGIAITAIAGIVAVSILAYNKIEWFRDAVNAAWEWIKTATATAFKFIYDVISAIVSDVVEYVKSLLDKFAVFWDENGKFIMQLVKESFDFVKNHIMAVMKFIQGIFEVVWPIISGIVKIAWGIIKTSVKNTMDLVLGIIQTILKILQGDWEGAWDTILGVSKKIWSNIEGFFTDVDLVQIGKDIIAGLIKGISSMVSAVGDAIKNVTDAITGKVKSILGIQSPSTVMTGYGVNTGQGMANGIASTKAQNVKAMDDVGKAIISSAKNADAEIDKILNGSAKKQKKSAKSTAKSAASEAKKQAAAAKKAEAEKKRQIAAAQKAERDAVTKAFNDVVSGVSAKKVDGTLTTADEAAIWKKAINTFKKGSKERVKAEKNYMTASKAVEKEKKAAVKAEFDTIKQSVEDKKSLNQLSVTQEIEIWKQSIGKFKEGTKERIDAQKAYQTALKSVNDKVLKVNSDFSGRMQKISDDLKKNTADENKVYTDAFAKREGELRTFVGIFDKYEIEMRDSGDQLFNNMQNQLDGFKLWQSEMEKISSHPIDASLLDELRQMGPKALPELRALNSMTKEQLTEYSSMYQEKANLARTQTEKELAQLKIDTEQNIEAMRVVANSELSLLQQEWTSQIQAVTRATDDELQSLEQIGRDAGQGLIDGLGSMESALVDQATSLANSVSDTIKKVLGIASPAKELIDVGEDTGAGFMVGLDNMIAKIKASARDMAVAAIPQMAGGYQAPESSMAIAGGFGVQSSPVENNYNYERMLDGAVFHVREEADIKKVARELYNLEQQTNRGRGGR